MMASRIFFLTVPLLLLLVWLVGKLRGVKEGKGRKYGGSNVVARGDSDSGLDGAKKCRLSDDAIRHSKALLCPVYGFDGAEGSTLLL